MANLKSASVEIENAKKVNRSSWEDSTYRQKIESTLAGVIPGLQGDFLTAAAKFFKPEWEIRSQKFLKRFMMWTSKKSGDDPPDLVTYAKFGTSQSINLSAMANNLDVTFPVALFQVVNLAAFGLCRRVEPTVSTRGDPVFNVVFMPSGYVRFFLKTMSVADDDFSPSDLHELATGVFDHEVKTNQPFAATNFIVEAVSAKHRFEERALHAAGATEAIKGVCRRLMSAFELDPNMGHSTEAMHQACGDEQEQGLTNFCLLVLALHDPKIVRVHPSIDRKRGAPKSSLLLSYGPLAPKDCGSGVTNIASLSTPHAKEVLRAAAAQSPAADPAIPTGTGFRLDAAALGAATVEQLQATEQALRSRIEQVGKSLRDRIAQLESDATAAMEASLNYAKRDQARVDALQDQVIVLMKLSGLERWNGKVKFRANPPSAPKSVLKPYLKKKAAKTPVAAKKKAKKAPTKKVKKKTKPRR